MTNKKGDKKGDKRKQKGDKTDTMTHKKRDKTGDEERMKGDKADTRETRRETKGNKADTVTNKKGDTVTNKKGDQQRQAGRKPDTLSGSKADTLRKHFEPLTISCLGKYRNHLENKRMEMLERGKGRTPAVQAPNWKTKVNKPHGKQMNRNAAWPAEKGGHHQRQTWETNE